MNYTEMLKHNGDMVFSTVILPIPWPPSVEQIESIGAALGYNQVETYKNIVEALKHHAPNCVATSIGAPIFPWQEKEAMFAYFLYNMPPEQAEELFKQTAGKTLQQAFPVLTTTELVPLKLFAYLDRDTDKPPEVPPEVDI
jgi:hypothetical protein